jgi:hypothetical protein
MAAGDLTDPDPVTRTLVAALEVLQVHVPDAGGWCLGCLAWWGRLVPIDQCAQVVWASAVSPGIRGLASRLTSSRAARPERSET